MNLDTRNKILSAAEAVSLARRLKEEGTPVVAACGWFDPVTAAHAERLERNAKGGWHLMAVVTDPPDPVLPLRARAELVAALAVVDSVAPVPRAELEEFVASLGATAVHRGETEDAAIRQELIRHVHNRQRAR